MTWVLYFAGPRVKRLLIIFGRAKPLLAILGWGACLAGLTLGAIFQGILVPRGLGGLLPEGAVSTLGMFLFYVGFFGVCVLASLVLKVPGTALIAFLISYALAGVITYWVLVLPGLVGLYPSSNLLVAVMVVFTFSALFPLPLLAGLVGTLIGMVLADTMG